MVSCVPSCTNFTLSISATPLPPAWGQQVLPSQSSGWCPPHLEHLKLIHAIGAAAAPLLEDIGAGGVLGGTYKASMARRTSITWDSVSHPRTSSVIGVS